VSSHATLIVKGTRLCNLRCAYCHDWRVGRDQTMTFRVLARTIATALSDPSHASVEFVWHGGETTVLPVSFYEKALLVQSRLRRDRQRIHNVLQTNGTRLTPEWVRFLRANRFSVGISLDGPPEIHDRYRRYASGRPSFTDVLRGIEALRAQEVPFGVLMVIDGGALELGPDRVFDFFVEHGIGDFGLLAAMPANQPEAKRGTPTDHYADPVRMAPFLQRIYDRWRDYGDSRPAIRDFDALRARLAGESAGFCTLEGGCLGNYYLVEPNGDVAHCDLFAGDERYTLGNVFRDDFASMRRGARMRALVAENDRALAAMKACPEFHVCNGWCPHERYISVRHNAQHRDDCCGLSDLIGHIRLRMEEERRAREEPVGAVS
jgi:uncharacterized protein